MGKYCFVNKVWASEAKKRSILKPILLGAGILILLLTLVQIIMGDFDEINWYISAFLPILFIAQSRLRLSTGSYVSTNAIITTGDSLEVVYNNIDRQDGRGVHIEKYTISKSNIKSVRLKKNINSIQIIGVLNNSNIEQEIILYPPENLTKELVNAIEAT